MVGHRLLIFVESSGKDVMHDQTTLIEHKESRPCPSMDVSLRNSLAAVLLEVSSGSIEPLGKLHLPPLFRTSSTLGCCRSQPPHSAKLNIIGGGGWKIAR